MFQSYLEGTSGVEKRCISILQLLTSFLDPATLKYLNFSRYMTFSYISLPFSTLFPMLCQCLFFSPVPPFFFNLYHSSDRDLWSSSIVSGTMLRNREWTRQQLSCSSSHSDYFTWLASLVVLFIWCSILTTLNYIHGKYFIFYFHQSHTYYSAWT